MAKAFKGFGVRCPACGVDDEDGGTIKIDVNDVREVTCSNCDWTGTAQEAAGMAAKQAAAWAAVARWVRMAPTALVTTEAPAEVDGVDAFA